MIKAEIVKKLKELSIEFDVADKKEILEKLLPEEFRDIVVTDEADQGLEVDDNAKISSVKTGNEKWSSGIPVSVGAVDIISTRTGEYVRTYDERRHSGGGTTFIEKAEEFVSQEGHCIAGMNPLIGVDGKPIKNIRLYEIIEHNPNNRGIE